MSYRNCYFDRKQSTIHLWHYNDDGEPIKSEYYFKPYIYLPTTNAAQMVGIDGVPLIKREFEKEKERRRFVENYKGTVYYNLPPTQQFLLDTFYHKDISEMTEHSLRTFFFDIEVIADEFPTASESKFPITSITIYDTLTKKYYVWGIKQYDHWSCKDHLTNIEPEEIVYEYCINETSLLSKFVKFWRKNFPDVISGWNSSTFDVPYIVGRIDKVFGEGKSSRLSPVDNVYGVEKVNPKFKNLYTDFTISGIAHVDYMFLYKTFTPGERESDGIDYVCWDELGYGKLEYGDMSLKDLYDQDWNKFINYNVWDVKLIVDLDEAKRYLEIAKFSAFSGFCNLDKAFGKTSIITGVLAKQSLDEGKIIPVQSDGEKEDIPGGYVKQPEKGLVQSFLSFDANSLYPSNIITLNISPETKMAKVVKKQDDQLTIYLFKERKYISIPKKELNSYIKEQGWSMSASGVMFDQSYQSISSRFCDSLYTKRKTVKDKMFGLTQTRDTFEKDSPEYKKLDTQVKQLDVEQYLYKILLNSTYGSFANRYFSLYDIDCAKSITTTGQAMIKQAEKIINTCIVDEWKVEEKDRIVMIDTDSCGITVEDIIKKLGISILDNDGNITPEFTAVENRISHVLNREINIWAKDKLNSHDSRYFFKRESICPKAMWTGKKHYIMYIVNKEGVKMNKFKYSGMQIAKSTFSKEVKDLCKQIAEIIMLERDQSVADNKIFDLFDAFSEIPVNVAAVRGGIKVLSKWEGMNDGLIPAKGTTFQAKCAIWHNELLKLLNIQNKYRRIENGAKLKIIMLEDNKYNIPSIAYQDELPEEFGLKMDREKMFFRVIIKNLQPIYDAMEWTMPHPRIRYESTLEELFAED